MRFTDASRNRHRDRGKTLIPGGNRRASVRGCIVGRRQRYLQVARRDVSCIGPERERVGAARYNGESLAVGLVDVTGRSRSEHLELVATQHRWSYLDGIAVQRPRPQIARIRDQVDRGGGLVSRHLPHVMDLTGCSHRVDVVADPEIGGVGRGDSRQGDLRPGRCRVVGAGVGVADIAAGRCVPEDEQVDRLGGRRCLGRESEQVGRARGALVDPARNRNLGRGPRSCRGDCQGGLAAKGDRGIEGYGCVLGDPPGPEADGVGGGEQVEALVGEHLDEGACCSHGGKAGAGDAGQAVADCAEIEALGSGLAVEGAHQVEALGARPDVGDLLDVVALASGAGQRVERGLEAVDYDSHSGLLYTVVMFAP